MDDLTRLNHRIAEYWLGRLDANQEKYLSSASVCFGVLTHSAAYLDQMVSGVMQKDHDPLRVAKMNCEYLRFARLAAKEIVAGKLDMLIPLGISLEQAQVLGNLSNEELARLALDWDGPIIGFTNEIFKKGVALHESAGEQHAAAFITTRVTTNKGADK